LREEKFAVVSCQKYFVIVTFIVEHTVLYLPTMAKRNAIIVIGGGGGGLAQRNGCWASCAIADDRRRHGSGGGAFCRRRCCSPRISSKLAAAVRVRALAPCIAFVSRAFCRSLVRSSLLFEIIIISSRHTRPRTIPLRRTINTAVTDRQNTTRYFTRTTVIVSKSPGWVYYIILKIKKKKNPNYCLAYVILIIIIYYLVIIYKNVSAHRVLLQLFLCNITTDISNIWHEYSNGIIANLLWLTV